MAERFSIRNITDPEPALLGSLCSLLLLDTQTGSHADRVYRHVGWKRVGEVPGHAADPDGKLQATTIFFKQLSK